MRTEKEIREKLEEYAERWRETRYPPLEFQPWLEAAIYTLEWVLEEKECQPDTSAQNVEVE